MNANPNLVWSARIIVLQKILVPIFCQFLKLILKWSVTVSIWLMSNFFILSDRILRILNLLSFDIKFILGFGVIEQTVATTMEMSLKRHVS